MSKFLIAGLGNIGEEYAETRHNVGFKITEALAAEAGASFVLERLAFYAEMKYRGKQLFLIRPTTYMNLSGKAVHYWMQQLKIPVENLLVCTDDIALPFGRIRMRAKGSSGGHNGLKDIETILTHSNYPRLRFGVGNEFAPGRQVQYVLGTWSAEERKWLPEKIERACEAVKSFATAGLERTMNVVNTKD